MFSASIQKELEHLETPVLAEFVAQQPSEIWPKKQKAIYEETVIERRKVPMYAFTSSQVNVERKQPIEEPVQPLTPFKPVSPIQVEQPVQPVSTIQPEKIVEETKVKGVEQPDWVESRTVSSATTYFSSNNMGIILFSTLFAFIVNIF